MKKYDDELLAKLIKEGKPIREQKFILKDKTHVTGDIWHCLFIAPRGSSLGKGCNECVINTKDV